MLITNSKRTFKLYLAFAILSIVYLGFAMGEYLLQQGQRTLIVFTLFVVVSAAYALGTYLDSQEG